MSGSLIKIDEEIVTSAVASVTLGGTDWDSSYDVYMVNLNNVIADTDSVNLQLRFTASSTPQTTANYDRAYKPLRAATAFGASYGTNQTSMTAIAGLTNGNNTQETTQAIQYLFNFNNSSEYSFITNEEVHRGNTGELVGGQGGGVYTVAEAHNGINYFFASGNIASGTFTLYGLKK